VEIYPVGLSNSYSPTTFVGLNFNHFSFKRSQLTVSLEAESTQFNSPNVIYCGSHNTERQTDALLPCDHILERTNALILGQDGHVFKETFLFNSPSPSRDPISLLRLLHNFILRRDLVLNQQKLQSQDSNHFRTNLTLHKIPSYFLRSLQERSSLYLTLQQSLFV